MVRGRPRTFDTEQTLDLAMATFWQHGYQVTSLDDLTEVMGITRPSLYAAFGDKEILFLKAIDRYREKFASYAGNVLKEEADAKSAMTEMLNRIADQLTNTSLPRGCLVANSTLECNRQSDAIDRKLVECLAVAEAAIYNRLRQAQVEGNLPAQADPRSLAQFYNGVIQGMAVLAKAQADPVMIRNIVNTAMRAWPT